MTGLPSGLFLLINIVALAAHWSLSLSMGNQFPSGGGSKGPRKEHDQSTKDKIRAELLAQRMYKFAKAKGKSADKYRMDSAQVAAAKVLIDKGKPSLQAVEQTEINQWD